MGRNSGKRVHRVKKFKPPQVPDSSKLQAHQNYGVITKYHGGADRNMDVSVFNAVSGQIENVRCRLKGSLRHSRCRQRITVGSYCVTDYEDVIIILKESQYSTIPPSTFSKLKRICQTTFAGYHDNGDDDDIDMISDSDEFDPIPALQMDSDDDIAFANSDDEAEAEAEVDPQYDIDNI